MTPYQDCYFHFDQDALTIGNDFIERTLKFKEGEAISVSLFDKKSGKEWIEPASEVRLFSSPYIDLANHYEITIVSRVNDDFGIGESGLEISVQLSGTSFQLKHVFVIYPSKAFIRQRTYVIGQEPERASVPATYFEKTDTIDGMKLLGRHIHWEAVELLDVTDTNNDLVKQHKGIFYSSDKKEVSGNLMFCRSHLTNNGLLVIKEGATVHGHLQRPKGDFQIVDGTLYVTGSGLSQEDVTCGEWVSAYGCTVGVWNGGEYEALDLLADFHKSVRKPNPSRDHYVMCNNWGDRSKDGRVSESFILQELDRAAELGVSHYQIDDGWQQGNTTNSVTPAGGRWSDYYADGDSFWNVHKIRFPNGLAPVCEHAEELGIVLGLWFSPDSVRNFDNWKKDACKLLELHRQFGIRYFKLDGIKLRSKLGESRLLKMMQTVIRESNGAVDFNLDATNEIRLGYFGQTQYGGLFVENRYTDWVNYYPHWTLRNLWMLSKYVPAGKLQMEFLNVERNEQLYGADPLAPANCGFSYSLAAVLFANPLAWMELTGLSEESAATLKRMLSAYLPEMADIHAGRILPIGEEPCGVGFTGLQSVLNEQEGFLIVFREWNQEENFELKLWHTDAEKLNIQCLLRGSKENVWVSSAQNQEVHTLTRSVSGKYAFRLSEPLSFALYRYRV